MEFENLQIEIPVTDNKDDNSLSESRLNQVREKKYYNRSKGFVVGLDLHSKESSQRKANRAMRFGLKSEEIATKCPENPFTNIALDGIIWPPVTDAALAKIRPEGLHLYGVTKMSTKDVFDYFKDHGPDTMEWIDDDSCNVVWDNEKSAVNALKAVSRTYQELIDSKDSNCNNNSDNITESLEEEDGRKMWRIGLPHHKADSLFIRQSTIEDRKMPGAAKRSMYYLVHGRGGGNQQSRGQGLVSSSRKRKIKQADAFIRENIMSKSPDVTFHEVDNKQAVSENVVQEDDKMDVDEDIEEPIAKRTHLRLGSDKRGRGARMRMYADDPVENSSKDKGIFDRLGIDENLKIEVTSQRKHKWTSGRRNHDRRGILSSDEDEEEEAEAVGARISAPEEISVEVAINDSDDDIGEDGDDLRKQLVSKTYTGSQDASSTSSNKNAMPDLRQKLHEKKKHLGLTDDQLNLCIEVTEVSDED